MFNIKGNTLQNCCQNFGQGRALRRIRDDFSCISMKIQVFDTSLGPSFQDGSYKELQHVLWRYMKKYL